MTFLSLITKNRSYRRFYQQEAVPESALHTMVEAARLSPSGRNLQPVKYILCNTPELNAKVFETLGWAGYLPEWPGPVEGERPSAYIVMLHDTTIAANTTIDVGIFAQSMLLQAVELGYGGCMIGTFHQGKLRDILSIPGQFNVALVIALGKPKEEVVVEAMKNNDVKYWRDEQQVHHVPKRAPDELMVNFRKNKKEKIKASVSIG